MTAVSSAIRLHNLTAAYRGHPAVHHLSGDLVAGAMTTAVVGPNGAGESSLLGALGAPCAAMKVASKKKHGASHRLPAAGLGPGPRLSGAGVRCALCHRSVGLRAAPAIASAP